MAGLINPESPVREAQGNEEISDSNHLLLQSLQWTLKWIDWVQRHDCKKHILKVSSAITRKMSTLNKKFQNSKLEKNPVWNRAWEKCTPYIQHLLSPAYSRQSQVKQLLRNVTTWWQLGRKIVSVSDEYPKGEEGWGTTISLSSSGMMCSLWETFLLTKPLDVQQLFIMFVIIAEFGGIFYTRLLRRHKIT